MRFPWTGVIIRGFTSDHQAIDGAKYVGAGAASVGEPIYAPHAGVINEAGDMGDCGQGIGVDGGRFKSRMCHNSELLLPVGTPVNEGQLIAKMGYSGYTIPAGAAGAHSHWILWDNGTRVDGSKYVDNSGGGGVPSESMNAAATKKLFEMASRGLYVPQDADLKYYATLDGNQAVEHIYNTDFNRKVNDQYHLAWDTPSPQENKDFTTSYGVPAKPGLRWDRNVNGLDELKKQVDNGGGDFEQLDFPVYKEKK